MIMVGSPILQDRSWVIEQYLDSLVSLDYPKESIHLSFLVNGKKQDNTLEIIQSYQDFFEDEYGGITVKTIKGNETDGRVKRDFNHFANIRNQWINLRTDEDEYVFSVDSDILVRPDTLNRLKNYNLDVVSTLINNTWNKVVHYNISDVNKVHMFPTKGLRKVYITGACYLIKSKVLDSGCKYGYHMLGEDIIFCENVHKKGFEIWCDQDHELEHIMKPC